jgi:hypothetical protein
VGSKTVWIFVAAISTFRDSDHRADTITAASEHVGLWLA